jgi:hypothetical protein
MSITAPRKAIGPHCDSGPDIAVTLDRVRARARAWRQVATLILRPLNRCGHCRKTRPGQSASCDTRLPTAVAASCICRRPSPFQELSYIYSMSDAGLLQAMNEARSS